jgi:hypothetical protein
MTSKKIDLKKELKYLFSPSAKTPEIIKVPSFKYIMVDGEGDPSNSEEFSDKVALLYGLSYTIKFMLKKDEKDPFDYVVMPLSGLWCADDISAYAEGRREEWKWTLMIMQPDRVTKDIFEEAKVKLIKKKDPKHIDDASFDIYKEGSCAQIMHIGPYKDEAPTIRTLHDFFKEKGFTFNGKHHEIYLSDPRKCDPAKMKTIIRQPIKKNK